VHTAAAAGRPGRESFVARVEQLAQGLARQSNREAQADYGGLTALLLVQKAAELFAATPDFGVYLEQVLEHTVQRLGLNAAAVLRRDELGQLRVLTTGHGEAGRQAEIAISRSVVDRALATHAPVTSTNLQADPTFGHRDSVAAYKIGAVLAVPLLLREQILGVVYLTRRAGSSFSQTEIDSVQGISALLAKAVSLRELEARALAHERRVDVLQRFFAAEVLEDIAQAGGPTTQLTSRVATVLHLQFAGLERWLATVPEPRLTEGMTAFRSTVQEGVYGNGGTLVYLREDAALAIFGGQSTAESDAAWAMAAGAEIVREHRRLFGTLRIPAEHLTRLGMDRGPVQTGIIGPAQRLRYVALGRPVYTARLLAAAGSPGCLRATEEALAQLSTPKQARRLPSPHAEIGSALIEIEI
jgi:class 3 adenylate cyclase